MASVAWLFLWVQAPQKTTQVCSRPLNRGVRSSRKRGEAVSLRRDVGAGLGRLKRQLLNLLFKRPRSASQASVRHAEEAAVGAGLERPIRAGGALNPAIVNEEGHVLGSHRHHRGQGNDDDVQHHTRPSEPLGLIDPFFRNFIRVTVDLC